jgi:myosin heavy subunit
MAHIYDIGTRAWQPDAAEGWVASEVKDKQIDGDKVKLVFQLENGEVGSPSYPRCTAGDAAEWKADDARRRPKPSRPRWPASRTAVTRACRP